MPGPHAKEIHRLSICQMSRRLLELSPRTETLVAPFLHSPTILLAPLALPVHFCGSTHQTWQASLLWPCVLLWPCQSWGVHGVHTEGATWTLALVVRGTYLSGSHRTEIITESVLGRLLSPEHCTGNRLKPYPSSWDHSFKTGRNSCFT